MSEMNIGARAADEWNKPHEANYMNATTLDLFRVLQMQGVHLDIIAVADDIAAACPEWAPFLRDLKERAITRNNAANRALAKARGE